MSNNKLRFSTLLFLLALFGSHLSFAQEEAQQAKKQRKGEFIGLAKIGIVTSQMYNDDVGGYNKLGGTAGVGVMTSLSSNLRFQLELNYAMRGSRKPPDPENGDPTSALIEAHYIDIPLLFKSQIWKFEYELGICNGIFLGSREVYNPFQPPFWNFNRYELALNAGLSIPINDYWSLNPRFHYSILPASGKLGIAQGFALIGGAYHNAISFSIIRTFSPR